jgi:hypothetical protein
MPGKFRDAALSTAALLVLLGVLVAFNPSVRDRAAQVVNSSGDQWLAPGRVATSLMVSTSAAATRFASGNTYMVFFLSIGGGLLILMLRT